MYRILIIEDDITISRIIREQLRKWDLQAVEVHDFKRIMESVAQEKPHLVLLDINLPYYDGFYWCEQIRKVSNIPILFISSRSENMDKIRALSGGGDDYIEKPFSIELLVSKIQASLRRAYAYSDNIYSCITYADLILDLGKSMVSSGGEDIQLSRNECIMLSMLMKASGRVVSRANLIKALWEDEHFVDENTLSVNMNRLRKKLDAISDEEMIETIKGEGYKMV